MVHGTITGVTIVITITLMMELLYKNRVYMEISSGFTRL